MEEYVRTFITQKPIKSGDKIFDEPGMLYADDAFFKIFSFSIIAGEKSSALNAPDKIVISQSMAKKYFGAGEGTYQQVINKVLKVKSKDLRVSAV